MYIAQGANIPFVISLPFLAVVNSLTKFNNPCSLAILKNGKKKIGEKLYAVSPLKNKSIEVEIISSHYVDPKGERVRS